MYRLFSAVLLAATGLSATTLPAAARTPRVEEASLEQVQALMTAGKASSVEVTRAYLDRIAAMDRKGPTLRSVIAVNPDALAQAKVLDAERRAGRIRGPLHGVPVLVKDNIATGDRMSTSAGSLALDGVRAPRTVVIGDAYAPRTIDAAIFEAVELAYDLAGLVSLRS